jgi:hypothetical protein
MKQYDPNKKYYFETVKPDQLSELMNAFQKSNAFVELWLKGNEDRAEAFDIIEVDSKLSRLYLKLQGNFLARFSGSLLLDQEILLKVTVDSLIYFTSGVFQEDEEKKLPYFDFKQTIYISQQRQNYRLTADKNNSIQLKIDDRIFDGLDISAGGSSFLIPESIETEFPMGHIFKNVILRFNNKNFNIMEVKVAKTWINCDRKGPTGEVKVGLQFIKFSEKIEPELFKHINTEARAEEMRKMIKTKK